jgi:hypothetical protein
VRLQDLLLEADAAYLILTLTATSLAKLRMWRAVSLSLTRQQVIPARLSVLVTLGTVFTELALSTLLALRVAPAVTGFLTAGVLVVFGVYRLASAARTRSLMCVCAGFERANPMTPQNVGSLVLSCLTQVALACLWALGPRQPGSAALLAVSIAVWCLPFAALVRGVVASGYRRRDAPALAKEPGGVP